MVKVTKSQTIFDRIFLMQGIVIKVEMEMKMENFKQFYPGYG